MHPPQIESSNVLQRKDGPKINDKFEKLGRWIKHYSELYDNKSDVSSMAIEEIPDLPIMNELNIEPNLDEVTKKILNQKNNQAAG